MIQNNQVSINSNRERISLLYEKYGGMLLGYLTESTREPRLAEEHLVRIFSNISGNLNVLDWEGENIWGQLLRYSRNSLILLSVETSTNKMDAMSFPFSKDNYTDNFGQLPELHRQVFCDVYYQGKSIAEISRSTNKTEDSIRRTLREAFAIIRKHGRN